MILDQLFPFTILDKVLALEISDRLKETFINANNVGKSKPCIFEIRSDEILIALEKVMEFKITCK